MAAIPNFSPALLDEHMRWHMYPGRPDLGGRSIDPFPNGTAYPPTAGSGIEFLTFHHVFLSQFHAWYDNQPFADQAAVAPWNTIPSELQYPDYGWTQDLINQANFVFNNPRAFPSAEALGAYIEWGLHGWFHYASALAYNEPDLNDPSTSPPYTHFYQIHGLIELLWINWSHAVAGGQMTPAAARLMAPMGGQTGQPGATQQSGAPHLSYVLSGDGIQITYALNSASGQPEFHYQGSEGKLTFTDSDIDKQTSDLGAELTVTLMKTVDIGYTTLTVLLPTLNMGARSRKSGKPEQSFNTLAIETTHPLGMQLMQAGVQELYKVYNLQGMATIVF